jgi:heme exporter protein C
MRRLLFLAGAAVCAVLLPLSLYLVFYVAPLQTTGSPPLYFNQKIFYWHVPSAMVLFAAVIVSGVFSAFYLGKREARHDDWALAAGQLAVVFGLIVLVTGCIWAKVAWGKWWVWDARLTSSLILWMTMLGYVLVRDYGGAGSERLAAGLSIFAAMNIPLVYLSTSIWRTFHPPKSVVPGLKGEMASAFGLSTLAFAIFFVLLLTTLLSLVRATRRLHETREQALDAGLVE